MKYTVKLTPHAIAEISETIAYTYRMSYWFRTRQERGQITCSLKYPGWTPCRKGILKWKENRGTGSEFEKCPLKTLSFTIMWIRKTRRYGLRQRFMQNETSSTL